MTKEELEKEAEEKAKKRTKGFKCQDNCEKSYVMGALDFAEPREKRIAELERKLEQTENDLADYQFNYPTIKELEKENAELKEEISTKDILIKELQEQKVYWKESSFDWRHKFFKLDKVKRLIKKDKQLTKAKEIIRELLSSCFGYNSKTVNYEVKAKAEQFLSEVEK